MDRLSDVVNRVIMTIHAILSFIFLIAVPIVGLLTLLKMLVANLTTGVIESTIVYIFGYSLIALNIVLIILWVVVPSSLLIMRLQQAYKRRI